jgi:hypothetical protein
LLTGGIQQAAPVLPSETLPSAGTGGTTRGVYVFNNVPSGRRFDPPLAHGFTYTMTSSDHFTSIQDFPIGFNQPFTVSADGQSWTAAAAFTETVAAACLLSQQVLSIRRFSIEEHEHRRITDGGVMAGEVQAACGAIYTEDGDVVGSLVATIEEAAAGVEIEAAGIVSACPFFPDKGQSAVGADRKDPDAVVHPVAGVDKPAIG